ncbi:MAG: hypothetical protein OEV73_03965 [Desulfobulbaceae bacterium]|nr:hypothetical protein [Desulfobulbaceae bacterium]
MIKPAVSSRNMMLVAALFWSGIGLLLVGRGWCLAGRASLVPPLLAVGVGTMKALLVLDRAARRNIARVLSLPERSCVGAMYSWRMWGMVLLMMVLGRLLRMSPVAPVLVGGLLLAVGWALLLSSRLIWLAWRRFPAPS